MKVIGYIIQKEFKQIFRNKGMLPIIFVLPLLQLIILSNAATYEVKNIQFAYIDQDKSAFSRELIEKIDASEYFNVKASYVNYEQASEAMLKGEVSVLLHIPTNFEQDLVKHKKAYLSITIDAIDGAAAGVESGYISQIIQSFNKKIRLELMSSINGNIKPIRIETIPSFWYNSTLNYKTFMVPGILVLLITMITLFLSGMNIVREKEIGTLEQINVTPIRKGEFIIGKLFPFWVIGMGLLTIGLILAKFIFNTPMLGNIGLLYLYTSLYLLTILGMGLLISNYTDTQQQAMFISWFFVVIFILMSGLFTPIESMPEWAQWFTELNPVKHFVEVVRMVMLKGAGLTEILPQTLKIIIYALVMNSLAVLSYKKVS